MKGAISDVCAFWRIIPAGCNSISTSFTSATAASVPSNGRYANEAVEPTIATPTTAPVKAIFSKSNVSFPCCPLEAPSSRRWPVHPHSGWLRRYRTHRKKQPVQRRNVIGSARAPDRGQSSYATIVDCACVEDVEETLSATHVYTCALCIHEHIVGIAAHVNACNALPIAGRKHSESSEGSKG